MANNDLIKCHCVKCNNDIWEDPSTPHSMGGNLYTCQECGGPERRKTVKAPEGGASPIKRPGGSRRAVP